MLLLGGHILLAEIALRPAEPPGDEVLLEDPAECAIFNGVVEAVGVVAVDEAGQGRRVPVDVRVEEETRVGLLKEVVAPLFLRVLVVIKHEFCGADGRATWGAIYVFSMEAWP